MMILGWILLTPLIIILVCLSLLLIVGSFLAVCEFFQKLWEKDTETVVNFLCGLFLVVTIAGMLCLCYAYNPPAQTPQIKVEVEKR